MTLVPAPIDSGWNDVIAYAEQRLKRCRLKVVQLEALIATFRTAAANGEPSPVALAAGCAIDYAKDQPL